MALGSPACAAKPVVYRGGPILTMDDANRVVEAIAVDGDRIAAVGSEAELQPWVERGARVIDLGGRALLPGFIDAHSHFPAAGRAAIAADLHSPPIGDARTIGDVLSRLKAHAAQTSRDWIVGLGYDDALLAERRHPTRAELDAISTERPIAALHASGYHAVVNSAGLNRLQISRDTPDPKGGRIGHEPTTGEPNGLLEDDMVGELRKHCLLASPLEAFKILRHATQLYLRAGVTTAQNGGATRQHIRFLTWMSRLGFLPLRLVLWPNQQAAKALLASDSGAHIQDSPWVQARTAKLFADGTVHRYTAYLSQPYLQAPAYDPAYRGHPRMSRENLRQRVARYHAAGFQVAIHGNGDAAIDEILDAVEEAQRSHPRPDPRHIVVHALMTRDDQLARMKRLGVIPTFSIPVIEQWGDRYRERYLGPERASRINPTASARAQGLRFTLHADAPAAPMEPLRVVWAAVNRRCASGQILGAEQRIDVMQALRGVTIDAAYQSFEERSRGSLEPGKLADFVILDRSPLEHPERIDQIRVLETIIAGRSVYRVS